MIATARAPGPPLKGRVRLLWHQISEGGASGLLALPEGTVEIVFDLTHAGESPVVCGPHARPFVIPDLGPTTVVGVHLRPGGAFALFGVPMADLRDAVAPLDAFWGLAAWRLRDRLAETTSPAERLTLLERALADRFPPRGHDAVRLALSRRDASRVDDLAQTTGLSARRLTTLFQDEVGLAPKTVLRLNRFQRALRANASLTDWGQIAAGCGYCDQSHLIRDFQTFAGMSPTEYESRRAHHPNHATA